MVRTIFESQTVIIVDWKKLLYYLQFADSSFRFIFNIIFL